MKDFTLTGSWHWREYPELGSTNDKAIELTSTASGEKLVVTAVVQTSGRGRRGRSWEGLDGNLFMSLAFPFILKDSGALVLMVSLALVQAIKILSPNADVCLKWPNDVLLNGAKVSGILLEKGAGDYMVVGIGVNVKAAPKNTQSYPVTSLQAAGIATDSIALMQQYLDCLDNLHEVWQQKGASEISRYWQESAKGIGKTIFVHTFKETKSGIFAGLNNEGMMILETPTGREVMSAGDVFFEDESK